MLLASELLKFLQRIRHVVVQIIKDVGKTTSNVCRGVGSGSHGLGCLPPDKCHKLTVTQLCARSLTQPKALPDTQQSYDVAGAKKTKKIVRHSQLHLRVADRECFLHTNRSTCNLSKTVCTSKVLSRIALNWPVVRPILLLPKVRPWKIYDRVTKNPTNPKINLS